MLSQNFCLFNTSAVPKGRETCTVNAMQNAMKAKSQTAYKGTSCRFTFTQNLDNGTAPSLENAYNILQQCRGQPSEDIQLTDLIR